MPRPGPTHLTPALLLACALATPVTPACPGGGSRPPANAQSPGQFRTGYQGLTVPDTGTVAWEPWWETHRELFYSVARARPPQSGPQQGSVTKYRDQLREKAIAALERALGDAHGHVRLQAAIALGKIGGEAQRNKLAWLMTRDKEIEVRLTTTVALGLLARKQAGRGLASLFTRGSHEIQRAYSALSLGMLGDPIDFELMAQALQRKERKGVQLAVLIGMGRLDDPEVVTVAGRILLDRRKGKLMRAVAAYAVGRQPTPAAVGVFAKALETRSDKLVQRAIAVALGNRLPGREPLALLRRMVADETDDLARAFALLSLARYRDAASGALIRGAANRLPSALRGFAYLAMGIQGDAAALPTLRSVEQSTRNGAAYDSQHAAALLALGMLADRPSMTALAGRLKRIKDRSLMRYALTAIGLSGIRELAPRVAELYGSVEKDNGVRVMATIALVKLGSKVPYEVLPEAVLKGPKRSRGAAALALGETANRKMVAPLARALATDRSRRVRASAAFALGHLFDRSLRHGSLRQLGVGFLYQVTPLDRGLRHIFAIESIGIWQ